MSSPPLPSNWNRFFILLTLFLLSLIKSKQMDNNFNEDELFFRMTRYQFSIIHLKDELRFLKYFFCLYFCHRFHINNNLFLSTNLFFSFQMFIFWGHWVRWSYIRHFLWSWSWASVDFNGCWRQYTCCDL